MREAIFSSLDALDLLSGARVLDLYAGSGALGLEAASRGATEVVLVDKEGDAIRVAKNNARVVQDAFTRGQAARTVSASTLESESASTQAAEPAGASKPKIEVVKSSVATFLAAEQRLFDLVFVDPPYELGEDELSANLVQIARITRPAARLVVERSSRSPEPIWPDAFGNVREKRYGETTVWTASRTAD